MRKTNLTLFWLSLPSFYVYELNLVMIPLYIAFYVGFATVPLALTYILKKRHGTIKDNIVKKFDQDEHYYHCIFLMVEEKCREHIYHTTECGDKCSYHHLETLIKFIASAKSSISLCMYHLTLRQIADELVAAKKRGVNVRIISDPVMNNLDSSKIKFLQFRYGFDKNIRFPHEKNVYMHHKFCMIDQQVPASAKLFLGSLNLTLQGLVANFEFVIITNNSALVEHYSSEFEILWKTFDNRSY